MTAIVGLARKGNVYVGGNSAGVSGLDLTVRADAKVFHNGGFLFGFTTSFRMGQLIRYAFAPPAPKGDLDRFMATTFIDALRDCLKNGGWAGTGMRPRARVRLALRAAERFSAGVRGPFLCLSLNSKKK